MIKLFAVFAASLILAYISERTTISIQVSGRRYTVWKDWAYILLVAILVLFAGLRTSYNDTANYIKFYNDAPVLSEFLADPGNLNPFKNPLFYIYQSTLRSWGCDAQVMVFLSAMLAEICLIRFIKRYSDHFLFSIFIYFTLGTFVFTLAAIKQVIAMAVLTLAFPYLEHRKWGRYYLLVVVAALLHTYALAFAFLPLFRTRPWKSFTFLFLAATVFVMINFEASITAFMDQANEMGKTLAEFEVFDDATINIFRLGVYAVPPLISFFFQKWVFHDSNEMDHVMIHLSIISFAFMCMGTQAGANMFGRMGNYFELGTICCLPWMLRRTFDDHSYRFISTIACVCFFGFFFYANAINIDFGQLYRSISLWEFLFS